MKQRRFISFDWRNPLTMVWFLLWHYIADRNKRMCVMASLYAKLMDSNGDDVENLKQLNAALGLSRDTEALRFPAWMARWLWRTVMPLANAHVTNTEQYITRLLKKTPCWLAYADQETRQEDIRRLVEYCQGRSISPTRLQK